MDTKQIAQTIVNQCKAIDFFALARYGANGYVFLDCNDKRRGGLQFKCSGSKIKRGGRVMIELTSMDLYKITLGRVSKHEFKQLKQIDDVYAENLIDVLEDMIG